ncbi:alpha/beta hydrolase [Kribbella sp. NBC_01245]|uniref:alpha/beta fold hydrolase n=1 Tax=Kribbella sp. NBC_01245 TaxID=2903578 RepID=UPI002E29D8A2|nr:alpha/beta hydrolase [Kribbella sp. NBC_01245]
MTTSAAAEPVPLVQRFEGSGGIGLVADVWGVEDAPPIVLLHGGGQTRGAWKAAGRLLAGLGWRVIAPDLRGHGESDWSPDGAYDVDLFADDVRAIVAGLGEPPVLVGASLGGLSSLLATGEAPRAVTRALVLVDVAHRPNPAGTRRIVDFMAGRPDGFSSLDEAADSVAAYLPHRDRPEDHDGLRRNLRRKGDRWIWHWDPLLVERFVDRIHTPGAPARYLAAARAASVPILLVRGAISDVVSDVIAAEFCAKVPAAQRIDVAGAGHMVAGDRNEHFIQAILPFLAGLRQST